MVRSMCFAVSLAVLFGVPGRCPAQTRVAPLYSLPADGVWVEFDFQYRDRLNRAIKGTMRISSTGRKDVDGVAHRWIEIKLADDRIETRYGKLLLVEDA